MKAIRGNGRQKKKTGLKTITLMVLIVCAIVTYSRVQLNKEADKLAKQVASLERQIAQEEARTVEIEEYKAYIQTKKYIEEMAREKLGLVFPDEIIFEEEQ